MKELTLITALGKNQDFVLELIDFFNSGSRLRYKEEAEAIRRSFSRPLTALHLVCTRDVLPDLESLRTVLRSEYPPLAEALHPILLDCADIACAGDDCDMRDKVYTTVKTLASQGDLIISSGGRKPVTQRLIEAGLIFGCLGYLTITADGKEERANTLGLNVLWTPLRQLASERRPALIRDELGDNFRSLYLLPRTVIERLQRETIGADPTQEASDLAWLARLPKADLHCHLGGAYDTALLKELATGLLAELQVSSDRVAALRQAMETRLGLPLSRLTAKDLRRLAVKATDAHCLTGLQALFAGLSEPSHIATAVLVDGLGLDQIHDLCRDGRQPGDWPKDLEWYMACGDLGGSALLQTEGTLRRALSWLMAEAERETIRFLEVRFSPDNYTRAGLTLPKVIETLLDEADSFMARHPGVQVTFLIMATRHKERAAMAAHVAAAVTFGQPSGGITGFDLAGQEEGNDPVTFQDIFLPLHHHFINITIHAGEMEEDDKIWQAIYLLHARRIGHGLKLINNPKMMGYIRDHAIAIEMCPSSNSQTNPFRRFDGGGEEGDTYPLARYLEHGILTTINTDNRGISATTLSREYLMAARLTEGGLSRWDILRLVKNGFKAAFLPKDEKDRLLKEIDRQVFELLLDDFFPEDSR